MTAGLPVLKRLLRRIATCGHEAGLPRMKRHRPLGAQNFFELPASTRRKLMHVTCIIFTGASSCVFNLCKPAQRLVYFWVLRVSHSRRHVGFLWLSDVFSMHGCCQHVDKSHISGAGWAPCILYDLTRNSMVWFP